MKKLKLIILLSFIVGNLFSQNGELAVDLSRYGTPITGASYIDRSVVNDLIRELERANRSGTAEAILNNIEGNPVHE